MTAIIKNNSFFGKIFKGFHNQVTHNNLLMTAHINLRKYQQDKERSCTFSKPVFFFRKREKEIFQEDKGCKIHFINCGQGDACLIENRGRYALIDFGSEEGAVINYLKKNMKSDTLDYAICTHIHGDHLADFKDVMKNYNVKKLIVVNNLEDAPPTKFRGRMRMIEQHCNADKLIMLDAEKCLHEHNHDFMLGNVKFEFIGPTKCHNIFNDDSIVLKMTYKEKSALLTGDISKETEKEVLKYCRNNNISLDCDILKIAHHGSRKSSCIEFMDAVNPSYSVLSCGEINQYSHPHIETIEMLSTREIDISYTYEAGAAVSFVINTEGELYKFYEVESTISTPVEIDYSAYYESTLITPIPPEMVEVKIEHKKEEEVDYSKLSPDEIRKLKVFEEFEEDEDDSCLE